MKKPLLAVLAAAALLATAPEAGAETKVVVKPVAAGPVISTLPPEEGGGYPGCWRAYVSAWGSHWTGSTWSHHFNPFWCGNGYVVTYVDAGWHYQETSGFYGSNGVSRWGIGGCVGCASIRFHAQARFVFNFWGWTGHFDDNRFITLYGSNGRIGG